MKRNLFDELKEDFTAIQDAREDKVTLLPTKTLASTGHSVSDGINMPSTRVVIDKKSPFTIKVPNPETHAAMMEADEITRKFKSRFKASERE